MTFDSERVKRPELVLGELLRSYASGELSAAGKLLYRAVVLAVDEEGGRLSAPRQASGEDVPGVGVDGSPRVYRAVSGPTNPRGSVKALLIDQARDSFFDEDSARVLWPLFPTDQFSLPISPGEHVYTLFEDGGLEHGLWVCRVSGHDGPNFVPGSEALSRTSSGGRDLASLFGHTGRGGSGASVGDDSSTRVKSSGKRLAGLF